MVDLAPFLIAGFDLLPKVSATIDGDTVLVLLNQITHNDVRELGGFVEQAEFGVFVKTSNLNDPITLVGEIITVQGSNYRVVSVKEGTTITALFCNGVNSK